MTGLISNSKNFKVKKNINIDDTAECKEKMIHLLLSCTAVIVDTSENSMDGDMIRAFIESENVFFTQETYKHIISKFLDENFTSNSIIKLVKTEKISTIQGVKYYTFEEIEALKTEKASLLREVGNGIREVKNSTHMIFKLAYSTFQLETKNTTLGSYWHIIRDIIFFVTYITFMVFLRGNYDIENLPGILFLMLGLVPWYYISDILNSGVNCIRNNKGIISKVKFPVTIIPFYTSLSSFYKRGLTYLILLVVCIYYYITGGITEFHPMLFIYINLAMVIFMTSFNLVISSLISVSKDFSELYKSIQRVQMYFLPVFWDFTMISKKLTSTQSVHQVIGSLVLLGLKLNPVAYILCGFRQSFGGVEYITPIYTLYFWIVTILMYILGFSLQYRLRKIYADVL